MKSRLWRLEVGKLERTVTENAVNNRSNFERDSELMAKN